MEFGYGSFRFLLFNKFFMGNQFSNITSSSYVDTKNNVLNTKIVIDSNLVLSEEEISDYVLKMILNDEVIHEIVRRHKGAQKVGRAKHHRSSNEKLWNTCWGEIMSEINDELLQSGGVESNSTAQKLFRLRFRVPYSMIRNMVQKCIDANIFGRTIIGVEFKLLRCLRILGRNHVGDDVVEHLKIGGKTVNKMFKTFLRAYADKYYSKYVYVPEGEEMDAVVQDYTRMGFPGCVGSMDVTHVFWHKCPVSLRHLCSGRYSSPTLAFQLVCSHSRMIHHVSKPFYGATNDITITYNDTYPREVMMGQRHNDRTFTTYNREGGVTYWRGGYLLVDGGYPKCFAFIDPALSDYEYHTVVWSEWHESIRKDVERTFNALKFRFRWLLFPVFYHSIDTIHDAFRVAAILHNRLLKYDGYDSFQWEQMDPNGEEDGQINNCSISMNDTNTSSNDHPVDDLLIPEDIASNTQLTTLNPCTPNIIASDSEQNSQGEVVVVEEVYNALCEQHNNVIKNALKKHLSYAYSNGQIQWPKRFSAYQREKMPILQKSMARAEKLMRAQLYVRPSHLRRYRPRTKA